MSDARQRQERTIILVAFAAAMLLHGWSILFHRGTKLDLDGANLSRGADYLVDYAGWQSTPEGLVATDAARNELALGLAKSRYEELYLDVLTTGAGRGRVAVRVSVDAGAVTSPENIPSEPTAGEPAWTLEFGRPSEKFDATSLVGFMGPVNLSTMWPSGGSCLIYVRADDGAQGPLVRSIRIERRFWPWSVLLLPLLYVALALAAIRALDSLKHPRRLHFLTAVALGIGILAALFPGDVLDWSVYLACGALLVSAWPLLRGQDAQPPVAVGVAVITFVAAALRIESLYEMRFQPLAPDAVNFLNIARTTSWFFDSQYREPGVIFLVKMFGLIFGDGEFQVRLVSLVFSIALVPIAFFAGRELRSTLVGFLVALLVATNPSWIWHAARGLRLEAFSAAILVLTALVFTRRTIPARRYAIWLGISGAAVCLLRITSVWFCVLAFAYGIRRRGWNTKSLIIAVGVLVVPLIPYWSYCAYQYGDPFHAVNLHIKFYRNLEFKDLPGMPTSAELAADPYAGPDESPWHFFFGRHSLIELARRTATITHAIFLGQHLLEHTCGESRFLAWWAVASFAVLAFTKERAMLVWLFVLIGPIAWLYSDHSGPEWRLIYHVSPLVYLCMALAADHVCGLVEREYAVTHGVVDISEPFRCN